MVLNQKYLSTLGERTAAAPRRRSFGILEVLFTNEGKVKLEINIWIRMLSNTYDILLSTVG